EIGLVRAQRLSHTRFVENDGLGAEALCEAVQAELGAFAAEGEHRQELAPLVLCGHEMEDALFSRLQTLPGCDAIRLEPATALAPAGPLSPAFGLALKGLRKLPTDINLLPIEMRKKPSRVAYYTLLFLVCLSVLLAIGWGGSRIVRHKTTVNRLEAEIRRLTTEMKGIDQVQFKIKTIESKVDFLNALVSDRLPALDVLKELSQRIPDSAWVQDFTFSDKGVQLNGYAESASELLPVLETSTFFKDATFLSTITKGRDGKERFSIGLKLR
ncbi:MAG: PilN domain-containing protein, partial [Desulfobacterales bacterium]|nr:PilN domain-containing protein [Desulfobacterales bacterium]